MIEVYHTLFAREHNRMCSVLREKKPEWKDEKVTKFLRFICFKGETKFNSKIKTYFLAARTVMSAKMNMVGSAYFEAYFVDVKGMFGILPPDPLALYVCLFPPTNCFSFLKLIFMSLKIKEIMVRKQLV